MIIPTKSYEQPASGLYTGVLADIVDLGNVTTEFNGQKKTFPAVRFVWFLGNDIQTGAPAVGKKDGKQLRVSSRNLNVSNLHEKSNIYKTLKMILNAAPAQDLDIDTLIGSVRTLLINTEQAPNGKIYANIMGITPAAPGVTVPIPADFVQDRKLPADKQYKNRPLYAAPAAQQAAAPAVNAAPVNVAPVNAVSDQAALIAALQAQLLAAQKTATPPQPQGGQGADVAF